MAEWPLAQDAKKLARSLMSYASMLLLFLLPDVSINYV